MQHLARGFVDDLGDRLADLNDTAAIGGHLLRIEPKTSILAVLMDGLLNLRLRLDAHVFTGLEIEPARGGWRTIRNLAGIGRDLDGRSAIGASGRGSL